MLHILEGPAHRFFMINIKNGMYWDDILKMSLNEYICDPCQLQIWGKINSLKLRTFMHIHTITEDSYGLSKLDVFMEELIAM